MFTQRARQASTASGTVWKNMSSPILLESSAIFILWITRQPGLAIAICTAHSLQNGERTGGRERSRELSRTRKREIIERERESEREEKRELKWRERTGKNRERLKRREY